MTRTPSVRRGVSLMEVLISMFVVAFGMLGMVAIIPVGSNILAETSKADRCGIVGRAALREIRNRRLLSPATSWVANRNGSVAGSMPTGDPPGWAAPNGAPVVPPGSSGIPSHTAYCIDPLLIARLYTRAQGAPNPRTLENVASFPATRMAALADRSLTMPRVTYLSGLAKPQAPVMSETLAERIFSGRDDLAFDTPLGQGRPRQLFSYSSGETLAWPLRADHAREAGPDLRFALSRETEGNYTWMMTLTPAPSVAAATSSAAPRDKQFYNVSVVVFYKRALAEPDPNDDEPPERVATVRQALLGRGLGGGNLTLEYPRTHSAAWRPATSGDWLLLCGRDQPRAADGTRIAPPLFAWYKVASTGDASSASGLQHVSVAGADWPLQNPEAPQLQAVLLSNVLGVYTTTLQLDLSTLWAR